MRKRRLVRGLNFLTLIAGLLLIAWLGWISTQHTVVLDVSRNKANSLPPAADKLVSQLDAPLSILAIVEDNPALHRKINRVMEPWLQASRRITLTFKTPEKAALESGQSLNQKGRLEFHYQDRSEQVTTLNQKDIIRAIYKMLHGGEEWIVFLEGHDEKSPFDQSANGYSKLNQLLQQQGHRVQAINLIKLPAIPDNTSVLVIAGPLTDLMPGEKNLVLDYLQKGGNLLLLREPKPLPEFDAIIQELGIAPLPGVVINLNSQLQKLLRELHPAIIPIVDFGQHPATRGLKSKLLLPIASALEITNADHWRYTTLFQSLPDSWNETSDLKGHVQFDATNGEKAGPLDIGIAASRTFQSHQQLAAIIGDSDFLSNDYIGLGDNGTLALQLLDWLTAPELATQQPPQQRPDLDLNFSETQLQILAAFFLLGLPLFFSLIAIRQWRKQH